MLLLLLAWRLGFVVLHYTVSEVSAGDEQDHDAHNGETRRLLGHVSDQQEIVHDADLNLTA